MKPVYVLLLAGALFGGSGCIQISRVGTPHPPAWIGAPAAFVAPNSLEGETWRERNRVMKGREYIKNPPPGPTIEPPPHPPLAPRYPPAWDPSHPFTFGP